MLNQIAFVYEESENQTNLFTPHHTKFDCVIKYGTNSKPFQFTYQCNTDYMMPNINDVMDSLLLDTYAYDNCDSPSEMADEFGYDYYEDKNKVDKIWDACKRTANALHEMFSDDELSEIEREINEEEIIEEG